MLDPDRCFLLQSKLTSKTLQVNLLVINRYDTEELLVGRQLNYTWGGAGACVFL